MSSGITHLPSFSAHPSLQDGFDTKRFDTAAYAEKRRNYYVQHALKYMSLVELQSMSRESKLPEDVVQEHLTYRLSELLRSYGFRADFVDVMKKHNIVISGSAVFRFMDPVVSSSWHTVQLGIHDLDLYVKKGKTDVVVDYLKKLGDVKCDMVYKPPAVPRWDTDRIGADKRNPIYTSNGLSSVVKLLVTRGAMAHHIDVIESVTNSPLYPILHFDLTACRNALSADGLAVYCADLTFKNVSLVTPFVRRTRASPLTNLQLKKDRVQVRADKYARRGFTIFHDLRTVSDPDVTSHTCFSSMLCPQTLRTTEDDGVAFFPFSSLTEDEIQAAKSVGCGTIMWRLGGPSCKEGQEAMDPCIFHSPNFNAKYSFNSRV